MSKRFLSIKNYGQYQHYKQRNPPWIKLHLSLLDDPDFLDLPDASKWHYVGLLLLASRHENAIKPDLNYIKNRLGLTVKLDLTQRFLKDHVQASNASIRSMTMLPTKNEIGGSETETETEAETEAEKTPLPPKGELVVLDDFEIFWKSYPRKIGKGAARKAWDKANDRPSLADILNTLDLFRRSAQWTKDQGQFIPHAATWLNQGRWADEVQVPTGPYDPNGFLSGIQSLIERHQA